MTSRPSTASGTHFQTLSLLLSFSSRVNYPRTERVWLEKIHMPICRNWRINRVYPPSGGKKNTPFKVEKSIFSIFFIWCHGYFWKQNMHSNTFSSIEKRFSRPGKLSNVSQEGRFADMYP